MPLDSISLMLSGVPLLSSDDNSMSERTSTSMARDTAGHGAEKARTTKLLHAEIAAPCVAGFFSVYDTLGFGFLERVYCNALTIELRKRGHKVQREVQATVYYGATRVGTYRLDLLVDD